MAVSSTQRTLSVQRAVPFTLRLQALFGGFANQFGWLFFGFGLIFFWGFALKSEAFTLWKFIGPLEKAQGTVISVEKTGASEGGGEGEEGTPIYAIAYVFTPEGVSVPIQGISYVTGFAPVTGGPATIEYKAARPQFSRIQGMRSALFDWPAMIAAIFPAVGLGFIIFGLLKGMRAVTVMRCGLTAMGTLVGVEATNVEENHRKVYRMIFRFCSESGQRYTASLTSKDPEAWGPVADESMLDADSTPSIESQSLDEQVKPEKAVVLYHPADPTFNFIPEEFGQQVRVDAQGNIYGVSAWTGIKACILPVISILGHGSYLFFKLVAFFR